MQANAFQKSGIQSGNRLRLTELQRPALGQRRAAPALDDAPAAHHHHLSGKHSIDPGEDRLTAGGKLHLQQLVARRPDELRGDDTGLDQRARLRGERKGPRRFGVIEGLDAERIAGEDQMTG